MGLTDTKYYVDDGYSGINFNRPGFQQLINDIKIDLVSTVTVTTGTLRRHYHSKFFKNKRRHPNGKENWDVFKNANETIIDHEVF